MSEESILSLFNKIAEQQKQIVSMIKEDRERLYTLEQLVFKFLDVVGIDTGKL